MVLAVLGDLFAHVTSTLEPRAVLIRWILASFEFGAERLHPNTKSYRDLGSQRRASWATVVYLRQCISSPPTSSSYTAGKEELALVGIAPPAGNTPGKEGQTLEGPRQQEQQRCACAQQDPRCMHECM